MASVSYRPDWLNGGRLGHVLETINSGTKINASGNIEFEDWDFQQYFSLLIDAFRFPDAITNEEMASVIYKSSLEIRKRGTINSSDLLVAINDGVSRMLKEPKKIYSMWMRLRVPGKKLSKGFKVKFDGVSLEGRSSLPKRYALDDYFVNGVGWVRPNALGSYAILLVRAEARSTHDATHKIFSASELFIGVTNLIWRTVPFWTDCRPDAKLWDGPNQFFWEERKFLANTVWYNPQFDHDQWNSFPGKADELLGVIPTVKNLLFSLQNHPLRSVLQSAIKHISQAMITDDLSFRTLRLWSALEVLYSDRSGKSVQYDKVIRRAVFAESDKLLAELKLDHLRANRNAYVHGGETNREKNEIIKYLRELLSSHVLYLIRWGKDIESHDDFLQMTDLPADSKKLEKLKLAIQRRENINAMGKHFS